MDLQENRNYIRSSWEDLKGSIFATLFFYRGVQIIELNIEFEFGIMGLDLNGPFHIQFFDYIVRNSL